MGDIQTTICKHDDLSAMRIFIEKWPAFGWERLLLWGVRRYKIRSICNEVIFNELTCGIFYFD